MTRWIYRYIFIETAGGNAMEEKVKKKSLSPKLQLKRVGVHLPVEIADWLYKKAEEEHKSLSYLLTELLEELMKQDKKG